MYEVVQDYYGKQLQSSADLKTSACCDISQLPAWLKLLLGNIHDEVLSRYYGCGLVCPAQLEGCRVLDLGCGTGRDVYALAQLVGASGEVVGVDMTPEQLDIAKEYQAYHAEKFGYDNVTFLQGYIEKLDELGLEAGSFDVIVSNCVINLSPDKEAVLAGVERLLKDGGEFYFSDVYSDRRIPEQLVNDPVLYGECLSGALYWQDFIALARSAGFVDPRLVDTRPLEITDSQLASRLGNIHFFSTTYRLFKLPKLEHAQEDYGQAVMYQGTVTHCPQYFVLDNKHRFETGRAVVVSGNTFSILQGSRFASHFDFFGSFSRHFGCFEPTKISAYASLAPFVLGGVLNGEQTINGEQNINDEQVSVVEKVNEGGCCGTEVSVCQTECTDEGERYTDEGESSSDLGEEKEMIINNIDLKDTGYEIVQVFPPKVFSVEEMLEDIEDNEYSLLENYYKEGYEFIHFQDEEVIVKNAQGKQLKVFGKYDQGFFATDNEGLVWLTPFSESVYDSPILINSSLKNFRRCYCSLLSILFSISVNGIENTEQVSNEFRNNLTNIDPMSISCIFYKDYIYAIEEGEMPVRFKPITYVKAGRHFREE